MRLDKLLASLAIGSRTEVQALIRRGRVCVGSRAATEPGMQVTQGEAVLLDGAALDTRLQRTLMMNKPSGVLTAAHDQKQRTVMDLLAPVYRALGCMPVGRLDKDTTGLLLFTTDGVLAHRLIAPKQDIKKVYIAAVNSDLKEADIAAFAQGVCFKEFDALPAVLEILDARTARITIGEGKFHQVKRMLHAVGHETLALTRVKFGPFDLDQSLAPGEARELSEEETAALYRAAGM